MELKPITTNGEWDHLFNNDRTPQHVAKMEQLQRELDLIVGTHIPQSQRTSVPRREMTPEEICAAYSTGLATSRLT